ncbi:MAG: SRPBCC family protein [Propionibacteriaceae bacterium]
MASIEPLQDTITVDLPPAAAFELFTAGFGSWWPAEFSWSQPDLLQSIGMECRLDGMLVEIGPHGFRIDWGRIISWAPPSSLSFLWQISADRVPVPDPDQASVVTVTFTPAGESTRVDVSHDEWQRHGVGAQVYRDGFTQAWPTALDRFHQAAGATRWR